MRHVLVTGGTGFVGSGLLEKLQGLSVPTKCAVRSDFATGKFGSEIVTVGEIDGSTDWKDTLADVDAVIHLAARVHVMKERENDPLAAFTAVNVSGTERLARKAAAAGVRRFVYVSSIKVNGESTIGSPFSEDDVAKPQDPYGISKLHAEEALWRVSQETGLEVVIIRPPLVYGPGVKANFLTMMRWLSGGVPLPLGAVRNQRSLVALENLVDLITTCIEHPAAANQTFLAADGEDLSTTHLLRRLGDALGKPARLLPVPAWLLEAGATMVGKRAIAQRLCGSLQVDISKARELLGWTPPVSVDEALGKTAQHFLQNQRE